MGAFVKSRASSSRSPAPSRAATSPRTSSPRAPSSSPAPSRAPATSSAPSPSGSRTSPRAPASSPAPSASRAPSSPASRSVDWDELRYFLAVVAAGSLSAAGRALRVNTTTVLRRIAHLEGSLEARLFERRRSGYALTEAGARLLETLQPVDKHLSSLTRDFQASVSERKGVVRLGLGEALGARLLAPALAAFSKAAPNVLLELVADFSLTGPGEAPRVLTPLRDVDLALRLARPTSGDMLMRKLGEMNYGLYGTRALAKRYRGSLAGAPVIGFAQGEAPLGPVWWLERHARDAEMVLHSSSPAVRAQACAAGLGLAALPCLLADAEPRLVRVAGAQPGALEIWLLARADMAQLPHVRAVMDFLLARVRHAADALRGEAPLGA